MNNSNDIHCHTQAVIQSFYFSSWEVTDLSNVLRSADAPPTTTPPLTPLVAQTLPSPHATPCSTPDTPSFYQPVSPLIMGCGNFSLSTESSPAVSPGKANNVPPVECCSSGICIDDIEDTAEINNSISCNEANEVKIADDSGRNANNTPSSSTDVVSSTDVLPIVGTQNSAVFSGGRSKREEFVTPHPIRHMDLLMSDDNITPKPDYQNMATPFLKASRSDWLDIN